MTYKEKYDSEKDWRRKVLILDSFHCIMLTKHEDWKLINTATSMNISQSTVSEDLRVAELLREGKDFRTRIEAVRSIRKIYKKEK